jgi:hypothetical protein
MLDNKDDKNEDKNTRPGPSGYGTLCFTLGENEMFRIGPDIIVTVKKYSYNQTRVCIKAPKTIRIERAGFYEGK